MCACGCVRVFVSKSGGACICARGSRGWRCEDRLGKVQRESFLGSVMFITRTHSCLDLIPLKSRNDLISQTEITVPSAQRHPQFSVLGAYCS